MEVRDAKSGVERDIKGAECSPFEISEATGKILLPLWRYRSQLHFREDGSPVISGMWSSNPDAETISHYAFFLGAVFPHLTGLCERFGQEQVAQGFIEMALPVYGQIGERGMGAFWDHAVIGRHQDVSDDRINSALAAQYGIQNVYGPILSLAAVHAETNVFPSSSKFFHYHACRMGEVISRFGPEGLIIYTELAKKLLRAGVYDWSIEHGAAEWEMLEPACKRYGLREVLEPMVDAMVALGSIPGANEGKYKYSLLWKVVRDLLPLLVSQMMEAGPEAVSAILMPIVNLVQRLHAKGAFADPFSHLPELFFGSFRNLRPQIEKKGIDVIDATECVWELFLIPEKEDQQ